MSKTEKLLTALRSGKEFTAKEIAKKFGLANPYNAVHQLRKQKIAVYGNKRTLRDGTVVTKYRVGTPTAAMTAVGFTS